MDTTKPGYKTTEFWISIVAAVFGIFNLPPEQAAILVTAVASVYTVGRSIVKRFTGK